MHACYCFRILISMHVSGNEDRSAAHGARWQELELIFGRKHAQEKGRE